MYTPLTNIWLVEEILYSHKTQLKSNYDNYRNHVYRVFNFAVLLSAASADEQKQLAIAAAFHDIGIWTAGTFDYLQPSVNLANNYLQRNKLDNWSDVISKTIDNHHKLTVYRDNKLVECFRQADLIDLTFAVISFGLKKDKIKEIYMQFPPLGFHQFIAKQIVKNIIRHPLNPLPILKR